MYCRNQSRSGPRRGATLVETAFVLPIVLLFMFGIFEYGRFMFVYTTATNAVRDGARWAVVHTNSPTATEAVVKSIVNQKMVGLQGHLAGYAVDVFFVDPTGLGQTPVVVQEHPTFNQPDDWKKTSYGDKIAVVMTGTYRPTMASFLKLGNTTAWNLRVVSMMTSEGN